MVWLHRDMHEGMRLHSDMSEVTTDELDQWADIAFADPYDPPAEKPPPTRRVIFAKMTDAIEAVAHKLNSAEYKELYDAARAIFEHCSRHNYTSAESLFISRFATMVEMEAREAYDRTRAGPIPPSPAVVFHREELPPPRTLTTTRLALSHFRDTGSELAYHERGS